MLLNISTLFATRLFLEQYIEAKNLGLGGTAIFSADGIESIFCNPAVVNLVEHSQIILSYAFMNADITYFLGGIKFNKLKISGNTPAFYIRGMYSDKFGYVTSGYTSEKYFSVYEYQAGVNYSIVKLKKVLFGVNLNFGRENYYAYENNYFSIDSGVIVSVSKDFQLAWVGKNIEMYSENSSLTAVHNAGISYSFNMKNNNFKIYPVLKITRLYIEKVLGAEYDYKDLLQLYCSVSFNPYSVSNFTDYISGGLSLKYKIIKINYAVKPSEALGSMHSFTLIYTF